MFRLDKIYRTNYLGENITTESRQERMEWHYNTEWVPTTVFNSQRSKVATIIGNGDSRKDFNLNLVINHLSGLLGAASMQTYGCNAVYRDFEPTFTVANSKLMCQEMVDSGYCDSHIVYTNSAHLPAFPSKFYLIPQNVVADAGTIATYLACFDGHEKIYLVGFDGWAGDGYNNNIYAGTSGYADSNTNLTEEFGVASLLKVMQTYNEVQFVRVMPTVNWRCPDSWKSLPNFSQINYAEFHKQADL
jgi:hypothetical protein